MKQIINVTQATLPPQEEYIEEIKDIWDSHWLTNMGEKHQKLQSLLKNYLDAEYIELFTNGHMALEMSLQALNLHGEVITTPFTFASTTHAIVRNGLKPLFCDINEADYTIDVGQIESLITPNTVAIMPVHVYGNICDVYSIKEIAEKHNLRVIYDAAHAFGEKYDGKSISKFGDVSCYSFHATKVFNTIEGGGAAFHDASIGERLYQLKNFGIQDAETVNGVGANAKMNEFCAAMGICNLRHLDDNIHKRKKVVDLYNQLLDGVNGIRVNTKQKKVESNYSYYPILIDERNYGMNRNQLFDLLNTKGIVARKYFYPLTTDFDCYKSEYDSNNTPIALSISKQVLTLPLYPDLSEDDVIRICETIRNKR